MIKEDKILNFFRNEVWLLNLVIEHFLYFKIIFNNKNLNILKIMSENNRNIEYIL